MDKVSWNSVANQFSIKMLEQIIIKLITLKDLPMCVQIQDNSLKKILDENQLKSQIKSDFLRKYK